MNVIRPLASLAPDCGKKICLIILNRPLETPLLRHLWKQSVLTAVADGAVNRLVKAFGEEDREEYLPDFISGDFDSAEPPHLVYYKGKGVEIIPTPDQDETDFTKCLRLVAERMEHNKVDQIVAVGAIGGRFDHTMASLSTLYTSLRLFKVPVILMSEGSMACLLDTGCHELQCDTGKETDWCGLVPVGQPALQVTTTGLQYNLANSRLAFGELISTSNSLASPSVTVSTDQPLVWTMGYEL